MSIDNKKYDDSVKKPEKIQMSETSKKEVIENTKKELNKEKLFKNWENKFFDILQNIKFLYKEKNDVNIFLKWMDKVARIWKNETPQEMYTRLLKEEQNKLKDLSLEIFRYSQKYEDLNFYEWWLNSSEKNFLTNLSLKIYEISNKNEDFFEKDFLEFDISWAIYKRFWDLKKEYNKEIHILTEEEKLEHLREIDKKEEEQNIKNLKKIEFEKLKLEKINLENFWDFYISKWEESIKNLKNLGLNDKEIKNIFENYASFLQKLDKNKTLSLIIEQSWETTDFYWFGIKFKEIWKEYSFWDNINQIKTDFNWDINNINFSKNISFLKIIANSKNKTGEQIKSELEKLFLEEKYDKKVLEKIDYYLKKWENSDYTVKVEWNKLYVYIGYWNYNNVSWHFSIPRTEIKTWKLLNWENMKFFWPDWDKHFDEFVAKIRKKWDSLYWAK